MLKLSTGAVTAIHRRRPDVRERTLDQLRRDFLAAAGLIAVITIGAAVVHLIWFGT